MSDDSEFEMKALGEATDGWGQPSLPIKEDWIGGAAAVGLTLAVFLLFREAPELGDDLDYWALALGLHDGAAGAWSAQSFHHFRWPVWGPLWVARGLGLSGLASYYAAPLAYFCGTGLVVFLLARSVGGGRWAALAGVALYAFHPYVDTVFTRPMPDLSEGFWAAAALLCWVRGAGRAGWLVAGGMCLAVAFSNRVTGAFAALALGGAVMLCEPRRWRELAVVAGSAAGFVVAEWALWAAITGDALAVLHANLGGRGRAGTGPIAAGELPGRFLRYLGSGSLEWLLTGAFVAGAVVAWRGERRLRVVVGMVVLWWLAISCAVQGIDPVRPMLRTSGRFLAGLAPLLAAVGAVGLAAGLAGALGWLRPRGIFARWAGVALFAGAVAAGWMLGDRRIAREDYVGEIAAVVGQVPAGTKVVADPAMRWTALLANERAARGLTWDARKQMVVSTPELEAAVAAAGEVWFVRSKVWDWVLRDLRAGRRQTIPRLASFLEPPYREFWLRRVIAREQVPDFVFLTRAADGAEPWPMDWTARAFAEGKFETGVEAVPEGVAGRIAAIHIESESADREPAMAWLEFFRDGRRVRRLEAEPPGFPVATGNTYFVEVPADCDEWSLRMRVRARGAEVFRVGGVSVWTGPRR